jgi:ABC-type branched-subunit amino acid transport system substrate-binding protein
MRIVSQTPYDPYAPDWRPVLKTLSRAPPDLLILASHIPDGVSFRRAMLAAHLHVGAFIGSTMAECGPDFGAALGRDAIGVFASDRPEGGFNPRVLDPSARTLYNRLAAAWRRHTGEFQPTEEGLAGFTAAWALFHDVLSAAARRGALTPAIISGAARALNLPSGSLPNGAGLRFATDPQHLGQNQRASAVIWQWQGVRHSVVVWPAAYATGTIKLVPLPR